jgi:preprotein translocase subunit SecG
MTTLLVTIHITACIILILIVLLQGGKGAEMGVSLGGGSSQTLFGSSGPATILTKITTGVAILFMITSLTLAYRSGHQSDTTVMKDVETSVQQTTGEDETPMQE